MTHPDSDKGDCFGKRDTGGLGHEWKRAGYSSQCFERSRPPLMNTLAELEQTGRAPKRMSSLNAAGRVGKLPGYNDDESVRDPGSENSERTGTW